MPPKWRCGPEDLPVEPTFPSTSPFSTAALPKPGPLKGGSTLSRRPSRGQSGRLCRRKRVRPRGRPPRHWTPEPGCPPSPADRSRRVGSGPPVDPAAQAERGRDVTRNGPEKGPLPVPLLPKSQEEILQPLLLPVRPGGIFRPQVDHGAGETKVPDWKIDFLHRYPKPSCAPLFRPRSRRPRPRICRDGYSGLFPAETRNSHSLHGNGGGISPPGTPPPANRKLKARRLSRSTLLPALEGPAEPRAERALRRSHPSPPLRERGRRANRKEAGISSSRRRGWDAIDVGHSGLRSTAGCSLSSLQGVQPLPLSGFRLDFDQAHYGSLPYPIQIPPHRQR